jgi:pimeloyl-ACP methyl ester carboxylesterase
MTAATVARTVTSADGTPILVEESGSGVPLVLMHGGTASTRVWDALLPALSARYRCVAVGRRGYPQSGEVATHSFEAEAQDVAAVLASLDGPAHVFGHSSGAVATATAALADRTRLRSIVLYEPPFPVDAPHPDGWVADAEAAVGRGAPEEAMLIGMRDGIGFPQPVIDRMRADPSWPFRVAAAPAWIREARSVVSLAPGVERFAGLDVPTLLLLGDSTEPHHTAAVRALAAVLPRGEVAELAGQGHLALVLAPGQVTDAVLPFLDRN